MDSQMEIGAAAASAVGVAAAKGAGGAALGGAVVGGLTLSALVVMLLKQPRTSREWAVALISTLVCSLALGGWLVIYLGFNTHAASPDPVVAWFGLLEIGGTIFAAGLPGWVLVRIAFNTMTKFQDKSADDVYRGAKELLP